MRFRATLQKMSGEKWEDTDYWYEVNLPSPPCAPEVINPESLMGKFLWNASASDMVMEAALWDESLGSPVRFAYRNVEDEMRALEAEIERLQHELQHGGGR